MKRNGTKIKKLRDADKETGSVHTGIIRSTIYTAVTKTQMSSQLRTNHATLTSSSAMKKKNETKTKTKPNKKKPSYINQCTKALENPKETTELL